MTILSRILRRAGGVARRLRAGVLGAPGPAGAVPLTAETIDLDDPAVARDPFPYYEALRAAGPVQYLARHDAWIVLGHEEIRSVFLRPDVFSNRLYEDVDAVLLAADRPEHTAVRRIVSAYFSREAVERLGAFAADRAAELVKPPRLDVVRDYGQPLSEAVAARLLGLDDATVDEIRSAAVRAADFEQYVRAIDRVADRAELYGRLRADGLDDGQSRSLVRLLWVASTKTSERAIAQCAHRLLLHPDVRLALRDDPEKIGPFTEEVLRLHQPEPVLRRLARETTELGGVTIPAGAVVNLCLAAANRDPAVYEHPAELRLDRPTGRHLSFGHGIHHCVGARLGRAELTAAVRALLLHAPRFRAAQPLDSVRYRATMSAHYIESLVIDTGPVGAGGPP